MRIIKRLFAISGLFVLCLMGILGGRYAYIRTRYPIIIEKIELKRVEYSASYQLAKSRESKKRIIDQARKYLNEVIPTELFPAWYGTPWSFNGNAEHPFHGSIACGSFVENVLKNAGFGIDHRMSAQPSEYIIKNMCAENDIKRFSNVSLKAFNDEVQKMGDGIYIVGLDSHVGFLYILKGKFRFVHAHGYLCVLSEMPSLSPILSMSKYRVVGKLFSDKMMEQWIDGQKIPLKYKYLKKIRDIKNRFYTNLNEWDDQIWIGRI